MVIDKVQQDRLYWIKYDVLGLKDLLYQNHVHLSDLFFLDRYESVYLTNMAVVLGKLNLT